MDMFLLKNRLQQFDMFGWFSMNQKVILLFLSWIPPHFPKACGMGGGSRG